jgi:hypothetical protein
MGLFGSLYPTMQGPWDAKFIWLLLFGYLNTCLGQAGRMQHTSLSQARDIRIISAFMGNQALCVHPRPPHLTRLPRALPLGFFVGTLSRLCRALPLMSPLALELSLSISTRCQLGFGTLSRRCRAPPLRQACLSCRCRARLSRGCRARPLSVELASVVDVELSLSPELSLSRLHSPSRSPSLSPVAVS